MSIASELRLATRLSLMLFLMLRLSDIALADDPLFERDIAPLLETRCVKCHGDGKLEGGLDIRRRFTLERGGDSGPAIVPGKPDESLLLQRVDAGEMPPDKEARLDETQRALLRSWIAAGAKTKAVQEATLEEKDIPSRVTNEDRSFWSFQPPVRPAIPSVQQAECVRTSIDAFLLARLEAKGLSFNADASKLILLRRLCFDLLGLPPTPDQIDEFVNDQTPGAYERLVDRLLASPQYGERWGRHWLDVAGYADSDGYLAADRLRPEAWRYRDYVVRALNADVPYDRFVTEQLAGDEITAWRQAEELTPEMIEGLAATGFLRTASDPTYPGYTEPNEIHQVLSDTMQIVGSTMLGLTVHCARCHAHKFDPLPQRDYYALLAVFTPALDPARWQPSEVRGIPLATEAEQNRINEHNQKVDARLAELNRSLSELTSRHRQKRLQELLADRPAGSAAPTPEQVKQLADALAVDAKKRNDGQKSIIEQFQIKSSLTEDDLAARSAEFTDEVARLKAAIAAETNLKKNLVRLRGLCDLDDKPAATHLLRRGDYSKPGAPVDPAMPEVLVPANYKFTPATTYKTTGRRAAFAKWLTDPAHSLFSRVHVNRVWAHHFGRGIVPTLANFGRSGAKPSHPELLDWLATEFVRQGWSNKSLHRLIVNSTAYRQTSELDEQKARLDPDNILLGAWTPRRHEGEVLRDATLAVSGRLNPQLFGSPSPVMPQGDGSVITADDATGNRRSIYLIVRRSQHLTMFDLFDTPMMEVNCPQRNVSTVPLQALAMLHGPFAERSAERLADRILVEPEDSQRLELAYRLLYARRPAPAEQQAIQEFLAAVTQEQLASKATPPTDAERQTAARAAWIQAALVLLNSSEFLYVH